MCDTFAQHYIGTLSCRPKILQKPDHILRFASVTLTIVIGTEIHCPAMSQRATVESIKITLDITMAIITRELEEFLHK